MAYRATHASTESLILDLVRARKSLTLEQLITLLPELTWNQVFRTVDELRRRGAIIFSAGARTSGARTRRSPQYKRPCQSQRPLS